MIQEFRGKPMRVLVIWEPVLITDWGPPSTATLDRIPDPRTAQFWDRGRLISHSMGEHDRKSVVWDHVFVYPKGITWHGQSPEAIYHGGPVVRVIDPVRKALDQALK